MRDNFNTLLIDRNSLDNFEISKALKNIKFLYVCGMVLDLHD